MMPHFFKNDAAVLDRLAEQQQQNSAMGQHPGSANSLSSLEQRILKKKSFSLWDSSESTTPMTTRCHWKRSPVRTGKVSPVGRPIRRIRSRSLGTALDRSPENVRRVADFQSEQSLLLPFLSPIESTLASGAQLEKHYILPAEVQQATPLTSGQFPSTNDDDENIRNPVWICIMYGMINATIVLPVLMSFGAIIYRDDAFAPYMPVLVKLTLVSGIVHQLCFSTFSSLPFAVGQVQDAGLIFLSSMASSIVKYCQALGCDDEALLATVTVGLSLSTALLGCGLVLVGYLRLGQYVQLLPTCVVGGYLAFIGWFCGMAGIGLMAGSSDVSIATFFDKFIYILPGMLGGAMIYLAVTRLKHMAALPISILMEIAIFYAVLWATGTTVEEVTAGGWVRQMDAPPQWQHTWDYLRFEKVVWSAFPNLVLTEVSMIVVVALSSSLDVAAIELELDRPLNYNHELKTVGLSNILSGITGGYTGSYIFSQSIFSLRAGIRSRLAGYMLAVCQIFVLVIPVPVLAYIPNFFFGSLLSMICIDLMFDWLWDVRKKITPTEYIVCLSTFGLIQLLGVEYGITVGVGLYLACKGLGFDVGVAKFESHDDHSVDEEESEHNNGNIIDATQKQYGSIGVSE